MGAALDYARGGALVLRSPDGMDANDLLREKHLAGFMGALLGGLCERLSVLIARGYEGAGAELRAILRARHERLDALGVLG